MLEKESIRLQKIDVDPPRKKAMTFSSWPKYKEYFLIPVEAGNDFPLLHRAEIIPHFLHPSGSS